MQRQSDTSGHNSGNGTKRSSVDGTAKRGTTDCPETGLMAAAFSRFEQEQRKAATMMKLNEDSVRSLVQNKWKKMTPHKKAECLFPHEKMLWWQSGLKGDPRFVRYALEQLSVSAVTAVTTLEDEWLSMSEEHRIAYSGWMTGLAVATPFMRFIEAQGTSEDLRGVWKSLPTTERSDYYSKFRDEMLDSSKAKNFPQKEITRERQITAQYCRVRERARLQLEALKTDKKLSRPVKNVTSASGDLTYGQARPVVVTNRAKRPKTQSKAAQLTAPQKAPAKPSAMPTFTLAQFERFSVEQYKYCSAAYPEVPRGKVEDMIRDDWNKMSASQKEPYKYPTITPFQMFVEEKKLEYTDETSACQLKASIYMCWREMTKSSKESYVMHRWSQRQQKVSATTTSSTSTQQAPMVSLYIDEMFDYYQAAHSSLTHFELNSLIRSDWNNLSSEERNSYVEKSTTLTPFMKFVRTKKAEGAAQSVLLAAWKSLPWPQKQAYYENNSLSLPEVTFSSGTSEQICQETPMQFRIKDLPWFPQQPKHMSASEIRDVWNNANVQPVGSAAGMTVKQWTYKGSGDKAVIVKQWTYKGSGDVHSNETDSEVKPEEVTVKEEPTVDQITTQTSETDPLNVCQDSSVIKSEVTVKEEPILS